MAVMKKVAVALLGLVHLAPAATQTPKLQTCSGSAASDLIAFHDVTLSNVKVGGTMKLDYSIEFKQKVDGNPQLKFTMTSGSSTLPCIGEVGSCTYKLCEGTGKVEKQVAEAWNSKCPIAAGTYTNSVSIQIPSLAGVSIKGNSIHIKIEGMNNGKTLGYVEFHVDIENWEMTDEMSDIKMPTL